MQELTPAALRARLQDPTLQLIDVRRDDEWMADHLQGAQHIVLDELPERLAELRREGPVVCYCKMGGRSALACQILESAGFADVYNLEGGITAYRKG